MIGSTTRAPANKDFDSEKQAVFFNASTYFIKNKTGELLMFMAGKKPAFTEMQPNEILPLDFAKHTFEEYGHTAEDLDNTDGSNRCLFEGVPSTDLQPNSDAPGTILSSSDSEENSSDSDEGSQFANAANFGNTIDV